MKSVDLFTIAMNPDLRCHGGARLADDHEGAKHRSEFPCQCQGDERAKHARRSESCQNVIALKPEYQPREQSHDRHYRHAADALFLDRAYPAASQFPGSRHCGDCARDEDGKVAKTGDGRQAVLANRLQQTHHWTTP